MKKTIITRSVRLATADQQIIVPQATADSAGAFLMGALEAWDPTLYKPLVNYTYTRDLDLRLDASMGTEVSSWSRETFGADAGTSSGSRKAIISKKADALPGVSADLDKQFNPLYPWGMTAKWSVFEMAAAALMQQAGVPVSPDMSQMDAINLKWNMDNDEMAYIGDTALNKFGLLNSPGVSVTNVPNGQSGFPDWARKTPQEILNDLNNAIVANWTNTGYALMSNRIGLPPVAYAYISQALISTAGSQSILSYLKLNNIASTQAGATLEIVPMKFAASAGVGGVGRMVVYSKDRQIIRFPQVAPQRTPLQLNGIHQSVDVYAKLGVVEVVRPEAISYWDGVTLAGAGG